MIIKLLTTLLSMEVVTLATLLFKNPLQRFAMAGIQCVKTGTGLIVVKTVLCTMLGFPSFDLYFVVKFYDRVITSSHVRAPIMGYCLFLIIIIERVHYHILELTELEKKNESIKNQNAECEMISETLKKQNAQVEKNNEALEEHNMALEETMMKMRAYCEEKNAYDIEASRRKARLDEAKAACMMIRDKDQDVTSVTLVSFPRRRRAYRPWYYH